MNKVIAKPWLSLQCEMIPGVRHAVFAADAAANGSFATLETWPEDADAPPQVLETLRAAMASGAPEVRGPDVDDAPSDRTEWVIACPLRRDGHVCGGVAVAVAGLHASQVPVVTQLMKWGSAWPAFLADQEEGRRRAHTDPALGLAAAMLEAEDIRAATAGAATGIARFFDARRVAIGVQRRSGIRVVALSGKAIFDRRSERVRCIEAALNEACDQDVTLVWPQSPAAALHVSEAHRHLSSAADGVCIVSAPLRARGRLIGALGVLRLKDRPFDAAEVAGIESIAALLGPALETCQRAERGALGRAVDSVSRLARRLLGRGHLRLKLATSASVALLTFLALAHGTHQLAAAAVLEGAVERELVAPIDGFVAESFVRAGARVNAGETLARLDDEPLRLERRRLESQREELRNEHDRALGALDHSATRVLQARIAQVEVQLAVVEGHLARTTIVAPFDGLVVSGDLSRALGSPVSRGDALFRLAPLDGYRVILEIEEGDVPAVELGMTGALVLAALPTERFALRVDQVNGLARAVDGRNVLEVEAVLDGTSAHLRPGMKGAARLEAGRERLIRIWTHRLVDRLRLWFWAWSPVVPSP